MNLKKTEELVKRVIKMREHRENPHDVVIVYRKKNGLPAAL